MPSKRKRRVKAPVDPLKILETDIQSRFITWKNASAEIQTDNYFRECLSWLHAIPNGFYRSPAMQMKGKREGITKGISDTFLPAPGTPNGIRGYAGLYIEFKKPGGRATPEQSQFLAFVNRVGFHGVILDDWKAAAKLVVRWLGLTVYAPIEEGAM